MNKKILTILAVFIVVIAIVGFLFYFDLFPKKWIVTHKYVFKMGDGTIGDYGFYTVVTTPFSIKECEENRGWRVEVKVTNNPSNELIAVGLSRQDLAETIWDERKTGSFKTGKTFYNILGEFHFYVIGGTYNTQVELSVEEWKIA